MVNTRRPTRQYLANERDFRKSPEDAKDDMYNQYISINFVLGWTYVSCADNRRSSFYAPFSLAYQAYHSACPFGLYMIIS